MIGRGYAGQVDARIPLFKHCVLSDLVVACAAMTTHVPTCSGVSRILPFALLVPLLAHVVGCRNVSYPPEHEVTRSDRLSHAYADVQAQRFVVIADFENPDHMELVRFVESSEDASAVLDPRGGRATTGRAALKFKAGSREDNLILTNPADGNWYLRRDWQPYDLLLLSVQSPEQGLIMSLSLAAGEGDKAGTVETQIPLDRGWNAVKLDLAEVGEKIPLDDIRQIKLALAVEDWPATVHIDDVVLAGNRVDLLGDAGATDGSLYVQIAGRRWRVGAGGKFELVFSGGQVVGWYNTAADPYRLRNLVEDTVLGPAPHAFGSNMAHGGFMALGQAVSVHPRILEMSPVRVVVETEWRFLESLGAPTAGRPFQRWTYTIYPTGHVYANVTCTARTTSWHPPRLGLVTSLTAKSRDGVQLTTMDGTDDPEAPVFALARSEPSDYALAFIPGSTEDLDSITERVDDTTRQVSFIASAPNESGDEWTARSLLLVSTVEALTRDRAVREATDYHDPTGVILEKGRFVPSVDAGAEASGFDPISGSFVIAPVGGQVRFRIAPETDLADRAAFTIIDSERSDAWVYVNHVLYERVARSDRDHLIFQLPGSESGETIVEVILRRRAG